MSRVCVREREGRVFYDDNIFFLSKKLPPRLCCKRETIPRKQPCSKLRHEAPGVCAATLSHKGSLLLQLPPNKKSVRPRAPTAITIFLPLREHVHPGRAIPVAQGGGRDEVPILVGAQKQEVGIRMRKLVHLLPDAARWGHTQPRLRHVGQRRRRRGARVKGGGVGASRRPVAIIHQNTIVWLPGATCSIGGGGDLPVGRLQAGGVVAGVMCVVCVGSCEFGGWAGSSACAGGKSPVKNPPANTAASRPSPPKKHPPRPPFPLSHTHPHTTPRYPASLCVTLCPSRSAGSAVLSARTASRAAAAAAAASNSFNSSRMAAAAA